ncbi:MULTISPECIES: hypothetical protein [unclassified Pseudoalteromonas]|uniref:hypothetical protein n=1 Tax=unclassified Pseudoalteromonas TaxID=194690 RepID=UPI00209864D4|nr:hypothetical protein [Pseudoalteromonas sp. XMcav2-N]MCO7190157.1 hypothetical protein [Pseudoalteromonas sp. XMcav2-N]
MQNVQHTPTSWDARFFLIAGGFMLINTLCLWARHFSGYQLSILWPAIPAIIGLASSVLGLYKLHPRIASRAPKLAKWGAGFALSSLVALSIGACWVIASALLGDATRGVGMQALIGVFMIAMVGAFICNAIASLRDPASRALGLALSIPVVCWSLMLLAGMLYGAEVGLSLDFYTNGLLALAFVWASRVIRSDTVAGSQVA